MNPKLTAALEALEPLAEEEIERLQGLIDTEEEKDDIDDEKINKLTNQMNALEEILNQIDIYKET